MIIPKAAYLAAVCLRTAYLHLALAHARLETHLRKGSRTIAHFAITYTEARTMPGARHHIAFQGSFIQRPARVGAGRRDSVDAPLQAHQQNRRSVGLRAVQLALFDGSLLSHDHKL